MSSSNILAFSSSRVGKSGYLENVIPIIQEFLGDQPLRIAFIPFAGVTIAHDDYLNKVNICISKVIY